MSDYEDLEDSKTECPMCKELGKIVLMKILAEQEDEDEDEYPYPDPFNNNRRLITICPACWYED